MVLNKQKYVKMGLLGMTVFEIALTPSDTIQFTWLGLVVGQVIVALIGTWFGRVCGNC